MKSTSMKAKLVTTESIVRAVLGKTYKRFGASDDAEFIAEIVTILETPTVIYEGGMSDAAATIRFRLWGRYFDGRKANSATCDLFFAMERDNELGWIREWIN
jgi:hypothetical protein